jgi:hypothetical protein
MSVIDQKITDTYAIYTPTEDIIIPKWIRS